MLTFSPEKTPSDSGTPDQVSGPESNRAAVEAARLEFEALPDEVGSEARKTAFIHLIASRGFRNRKAAKDAKS